MSVRRSPHKSRSRMTGENDFYQPSEQLTGITDIKSLKTDNQLWNQAYKEIVKIFMNIIPSFEEISKDSSNKQNTLIRLCKEVAKIAKDPKNSKEYKDLSKSLQECKEKMNDLTQKNSAIINDVYEYSQIKSYDNENPDNARMTFHLNNIDSILTREIEQNRQYLPNHLINIKVDANEEPQLSKKPSNILSSPQRKKGKSIFPSVSELLSPNFNKKIKNDIFQYNTEVQDLHNPFDANNKSEMKVSVVKATPTSFNQQNLNELQISKPNKPEKEEIPFGKRPVRKKSRNRVRSKKS
ncbi:hypothetical protein M9Y10_024572 [Tritrichomonas musculus]|uniref:Uncharacterized protein n=1 Tax=Tritrichomonas musculus TaxID=1915356 RepID=A0ABR2HEL7_9EUKA